MNGVMAAIQRLGAWLRSMGPKAADKAVAAVGPKSGGLVKDLSSLVAFATSSPTNAVLTLTNLAMTGFMVSDLFTPADKLDPEVRLLAGKLTATEMAVIEGRIDEVAAASEELEGVLGSKTDLVLLQRVLTWARGHYGSPNAAIEAHRMSQAFAELSHSDVKAGYELLNLG